MAAVISDPVLAYAAFGLQSSTTDHVKQVILDFFRTDELITARDILWESVADKDSLPKYTKRQYINTPKGALLTIGDLLDAINVLKIGDCMPRFTVDFDKLHRVPLSKPCETSSISLCDRLSRLEARLEASENLIARNSCKIEEMAETRPAIVVARRESAATNDRRTPQGTPERSLWDDTTLQQQLQQQQQQPQKESWSSVAAMKGSESEFEDKTKKRKRTRLEGAAEKSSCLTAGPQKFEMQITNVNPSINEESLKKYITDKDKAISPVCIKDMTSEGWETKRFVLTFCNQDLEKVMNEDFWPPGIFFRQWFKPRQPRRDNSQNNHGAGSINV